MPSLAKHQSSKFTKLILLGDSKSGKTGSVASLVCEGYKVRILDMDNGLDVLKQFVMKNCPDKVDNVEYRTLRDNYKASPIGPIIDGPPRAFPDALKMLDRWKYKDEDGNEIDLGDPAEWGEDTILVVDSLSFLSDAAFAFREPMAKKGDSGKYDMRSVYGDAQDAIEKVLDQLTSDKFCTNVIVIAHVRYVDNPDGTKKGYPVSVGSALSPTIPRYFNTVIRYKTVGSKRTIETVSSAMFDLANPAPFAVQNTYPLETGLADIFKVLRAQSKEVMPSGPKQPVSNDKTPERKGVITAIKPLAKAAQQPKLSRRI